jgi:hypothetical protein
MLLRAAGDEHVHNDAHCEEQCGQQVWQNRGAAWFVPDTLALRKRSSPHSQPSTSCGIRYASTMSAVTLLLSYLQLQVT